MLWLENEIFSSRIRNSFMLNKNEMVSEKVELLLMKIFKILPLFFCSELFIYLILLENGWVFNFIRYARFINIHIF